MTVKEKLINEINEFSESKLCAIREYVEFLNFKEIEAAKRVCL
jgi:hypothetical protein